MASKKKLEKTEGKKPLVFDVLPPNRRGRVFRSAASKGIASKKDAVGPVRLKAEEGAVRKTSVRKVEIWRSLSLAAYVVGLVSLVFVLRQTLSAFDDKTAHVEFFAGSLRATETGGWKNIDRALGEPEVSPAGSRQDFSSDNSAVYEGGAYSLIAENFTTREFIRVEVPAEPASAASIPTDPIEGFVVEAPVSTSTESSIETAPVSTSTDSVPTEAAPEGVEPGMETVLEDIGHLPTNEDIAASSTPIQPEAPVQPEAASASVEPTSTEEPALEPVSKFDILKKQLAAIFGAAAVSAQEQMAADDRDEIFGVFRAARIKVSLAAFEKAWDNAAPTQEFQSENVDAGNVEPANTVVEESIAPEQTQPEVVPAEAVTDVPTPAVEQEERSPAAEPEVVSEPAVEAPAVEQVPAAEVVSEPAGPVSRLFDWLLATEAKAQVSSAPTKAVIWYSISSTSDDESWQELYSLQATDLSNAENGGYLIFPAPFLGAWQDIDDLKIKFEGRTPQGENFFFYVDAVWVEADYIPAKEESEPAQATGTDEDVLELDGQKVYFDHTDDNSGENLIIRTNKKDYFGLSNAEVYFSVKNTGLRDEEIDLQFYFPSATSGVVKLEKLVKNSPYITEVPRFEPAIFECANGWDARDGHYECYPSLESRDCDLVSPNRRFCRIENYVSGSVQEIRYRNRWSEVLLSQFPIYSEKSFLSRILALGPQAKDVPEDLIVDASTLESVDLIAPGEVKYYKATIHFAPNSEGEFYIEAFGSGEGYGLLDPWWNSGWNFRMPIDIDNRSGFQTLTDHQFYISISSTSVDFWRNVKSTGGDIRFVNAAEDTELDFWMQSFDATASSADFWVQVPSVSAASTTKIYLYYGNSSATTTSNQYSPFQYSSIQDIYKVVSVATSTTIKVVSLIDNNSVQVDDGGAVALNRQGVTTFSTYTASSTVKAKGPIAVKVTDGPASAPAAPVSFAGRSFAFPAGGRDLEIFNALPVLADATTTVYDGLTSEWSQLIVSGHSRTIESDIASDSLPMIEASAPVLVSVTTNFPGDGLIMYPSTGEDLYGVKSQYNLIGATATSTFDILCSSRASSSVSSLGRGTFQANNACSGSTEGSGDAVRLDVKSGALAAIQQNDSDGRQGTVFLPYSEMSSEYMFPTNAAYIAVVCPPRSGSMVLSVYNEVNTFVASTTCASQDDLYPGKAYFGSGDVSNFNAGSRIVSSNGKPFYAYYEDMEATGDIDGDETNVWGAVQGRKYAYPAPTYAFGSHEVKGPPTGSFNSAAQKGDGTGEVLLSLEIDDVTNDDCRAKIEYYSDIACHGSPLDPTLSEDDASTTADYSDPKVYNEDAYQIGTSTGWIKTASGTNTVLASWTSTLDLPAGDGTYCLKLTANDQLNDQAAAATTTVTIDNVVPTAPGALTVSEKTGTSITLNFPATTTETNFAEYKIFYKAYDGTAPEETDSLWGSSSESDLGDIDFNHQATTTVTGLVSGQRYSFNIFAYDQYGHVASSSGPIDAYANNQPTAYFNSVGQKSDGSGAVDISIEVDDGDNSDVVRAKVEYAAMTAGDCVFASPLDPTLDASAISSDYGAVHIDNDDAYQVGTTSFFIITSPGANTIDFDWLSKVDVGIATGTYCLRVTASDGFDDQVVPATTSLTIDNVKPVAAGNLVIGSVSYNSVRLVLPTASRASDDNEPGTNAYRIFYRLGTSGVTEVDSEHDGAFLDAYDFGGATSTLVSGLSQGSNYAFNIWAYDAYGNKASSTEVTAATDGIVTNKGLSFIDAQSAGTTTLVAVASGTFTFRAQVQDSDGWGALDYVILRLANRNDDSAPFDDLRFKWDRASDAFSEIGADASGMASVMPSSASDCSDAVCYLDFRLAFTKNFAATSTSYSVQLYSSDTDVPAHTDEDTYSNVFQVRKSWLDQIHYRWRNDDGGG